MSLNIPSFNQETSNDGIWFPHPANPDVEFKIARFGNEAYTAEMKHNYKVNKHALDNKLMSEEAADRMMVKALATWILLDWRGLKEGAKEIKYSVDEAIKLLSEKKYIELRLWITQVSKDAENYRETGQKKQQTA